VQGRTGASFLSPLDKEGLQRGGKKRNLRPYVVKTAIWHGARVPVSGKKGERRKEDAAVSLERGLSSSIIAGEKKM